MTAPNDTKPALLPAARLAKIREALAAFEACPVASALQDDAAYDCARALGEVLAHLDTLTAPAPEGGGRRLYYALNPFAHHRAWEAHDADVRDRYDAQALALDAHGYARGRAEGEAERARLRQVRDDALAQVERHLPEIVKRDAEIARLTEARNVAEARDGVQHADEVPLLRGVHVGRGAALGMPIAPGEGRQVQRRPRGGRERGVMASEQSDRANDRWLLGFGTACWILARFPSGMGARGLMAEAKVTIDDLRTAGMMEQEIAEIERASK